MIRNFEVSILLGREACKIWLNMWLFQRHAFQDALGSEEFIKDITYAKFWYTLLEVEKTFFKLLLQSSILNVDTSLMVLITVGKETEPVYCISISFIEKDFKEIIYNLLLIVECSFSNFDSCVRRFLPFLKTILSWSYSSQPSCLSALQES